MKVLDRSLAYLLAVVVLLLVRAPEGRAQVTLSSLSLTYEGFDVYSLIRGDQGDMYDFCVTASSGSVSGIGVDIKYSLNGIDQGWVTTSALDSNGCVTLQTSMQSPTGYYLFERVRDNNGGNPGPELVTNRGLSVWDNVSGFALNSSSGFAGESYLVISTTSGWGQDIRVKYTWDGQEQIGDLWINYQGQNQIGPLDHYLTGHFVYTAVQYAQAQPHNWTTLGSPPVYDVYPPQPTSLSLNTGTIAAGSGSGYRISANNGADVTLNTAYQFPIGTNKPTLWGWPALSRVGSTWNGQSAVITATKCTEPGTRRDNSVQNAQNSAFGISSHWRNYDADIDITYSGSPTVASKSPAWGAKGQNVVVTLTGQNLCGVSFSTSHPGVTFTGIEYPGYSNPEASDGTSVRATFQIASNATVGNASITLTARGGNVNFTFDIIDSAPPTISSVSPSFGVKGTSPSVTIIGTNLVYPTVTTTWSSNHLNFTNVVWNPNGTSVTATFNVGSGASTGNPPIKIQTPVGEVTTTLFSVVTTAPVSLTREYIYLGDRVIAVEAP
jgi:hypothetical protein